MSVFSTVKYTTVGLVGAFGRNQWQRGVLGRVDKLGFDRLVPKSWRYVMIGIARKKVSSDV